MDMHLMRLHQQQIAHQSHAAGFAVEQMQVALDRRDNELFWAGVQNFLTAVANVSKGLYGAGGKLLEERRPLRDSLAVPDDSALANTDLRNHLEHYDERLDRWYRTSTWKNNIDYVMGPRAGTIAGAELTDIFRWFDPTTPDANVIFWGEAYSLAELRGAIEISLRSLTVRRQSLTIDRSHTRDLSIMHRPPHR